MKRKGCGVCIACVEDQECIQLSIDDELDDDDEELMDMADIIDLSDRLQSKGRFD